MSNITHTPEPWEAVSNLVRTARTADGGGVLVAECPANTGHRIEDARLISAAPDLLAALAGLLDVVGVRIDDPRIAQFDAARAAIAKATQP